MHETRTKLPDTLVPVWLQPRAVVL